MTLLFARLLAQWSWPAAPRSTPSHGGGDDVDDPRLCTAGADADAAESKMDQRMRRAEHFSRSVNTCQSHSPSFLFHGSWCQTKRSEHFPLRILLFFSFLFCTSSFGVFFSSFRCFSCVSFFAALFCSQHSPFLLHFLSFNGANILVFALHHSVNAFRFHNEKDLETTK